MDFSKLDSNQQIAMGAGVTETTLTRFGLFLALIAAGVATWATYQGRTDAA